MGGNFSHVVLSFLRCLLALGLSPSPLSLGCSFFKSPKRTLRHIWSRSCQVWCFLYRILWVCVLLPAHVIARICEQERSYARYIMFVAPHGWMVKLHTLIGLTQGLSSCQALSQALELFHTFKTHGLKSLMVGGWA